MSLAEDLQGAAPRFETAEAFLDWAERQPEHYELIDGVARRMPFASLNHSRLSGNALVALTSRLASSPYEAFGFGLAVILGPRTIVFPDLSVSREPEESPGLTSPLVIFEVLSPSTAAYDLGDKATSYRRLSSVRHLVLIQQDRISVQHFHRAAAGEDFILTELGSVDGLLALAAISVEIRLADLYARVDFLSR